MQKVKLLDHGHVGLVDSMGSDLSIVRNARVSYDAEWRAGQDKGSDERLIKYLYNNGHNTPFEAVVFTFDVKAPIFIMRKWMRHRTQSYNELSARYRELPSEYYVPEPRLIGSQNKDNKQMRDIMTEAEFEALPEREKQRAYGAHMMLKKQGFEAFETYKMLIANGTPRELARTALPTGTYSHMFTTVNLHNLFAFLRERLHEHAQYEIRVYAEAMLEMIEPVVPVATAAFKKRLEEKGW